MTIVYLYTALCTVGGADRSIIQKANYLADENASGCIYYHRFTKRTPARFPDISQNQAH